MLIDSSNQFIGQHCETTTTGTLLQHLGIELSEPMLFGLGEGLAFIFWKMKSMDFPFIGGRIKPDLLTENICRNLKLQLHSKQTASVKKAWNNVSQIIDAGTPVGLKLDCYHLEYFNTKIHFAGHYAALHGYDDQYAYLVDTELQGGLVKTSRENLALARSEKGPMSSKNLSFTISSERKPAQIAKDIPSAITTAIHNNAQAYLNPPIKNFGYPGILKTSQALEKWFLHSDNPNADFETTSMLMERAGTGGALFRNFYRDFLQEAYRLTSQSELKKGAKAFEGISILWTQVSQLFHEAAKTSDLKPVHQASDTLLDIAKLEQKAMQDLLSATDR